MGRRRAGMWVGGMPGLWAGREEGLRRAGTSGVPARGPIVPGRWVCLADGAEACRMWGGGMPGLGLGAGRDEGRRRAGTWGVGP
jgi:hypothetical protein